MNNKEKIKEMVLKKLSLKDIAQKLSLEVSTIENKVEEIKNNNPDVNLSYLKPKNDIFKKVNKAIDCIKKRQNQMHIGMNELKNKDIFNELNEKISYWDIRLVRLFIKEQEYKKFKTNLTKEEKDIIENNFVDFDSVKNSVVYGIPAFLNWKQKHFKKDSVVEFAKKYIVDVKAINKKRKNGVIGVSHILIKYKDSIKEPIYLKDLVCVDYCRAGGKKSKLMFLLEETKRSTSNHDKQKKAGVEFMKSTVKNVKKYINFLKPDSIIFIPHSVKRNYQIMEEYKKLLKNNITIDDLKKKPGFRAQKELSKMDEKKINADSSFSINKKKEKNYKKILLIDDLSSSGATLNQMAKKVYSKYDAKDIYGIAILGSDTGILPPERIA